MLLAACLPLAAAYSFSAPGAHMRALVQPVVQGRSVANVAMAVKTASIAMPALSSTMTEGKISEWLVSVGDKVSSAKELLIGPLGSTVRLTVLRHSRFGMPDAISV